MLKAYWRQWRATWAHRYAELRRPRDHQGAWRGGYGSDAAGLREVAFETAVRLGELAGVGLLYSAAEAGLAGYRYRALDAGVWQDEGARSVAGRLGIAYVSGFVVKSAQPLSASVLAHELTHVRQFRRWGWAYVAKCLAAQWWGGGYGYTRRQAASFDREGYRRFNAEQEAAHVEDLARRRAGLAPRHAT